MGFLQRFGDLQKLVLEVGCSFFQDCPGHQRNSSYFRLSRQVPKIVGIVLASFLLSLGMQNTAFAVLASIEQAEQVGNSFQETVLFDLLSQDNSSFLLTKLHRNLYRTAHKTSSIQQLVKTSHLNSDYYNLWRIPTAIILSQGYLRPITPRSLPPSTRTTPPRLPPSTRTTPSYPAPSETRPESSNTFTEPGTIPATSSPAEIQEKYFTVDELGQLLDQKVRALQAEGKNLSPADAERLLGAVKQLMASEAGGRKLSPAEVAYLLDVVEQFMKDSNPSDSSVEATLTTPVTPRVSPPERYRRYRHKEWSWRDNPLTPDESRRLLLANTLGSRSIIIERSSNGYAVLRSGTNQVVEVHTINSFYDDVLPQFMSYIPNDDSPIRIFLNGFTPDEAKAFTLTGDLRQKVQQFSCRRNSSFFENVALLNRSYNWNDATIKEVKIEPFSVDSKSGYRGIIDIEIASTNPTRPSLRIRIVTFLKGLPKEIAMRIETIIKRVLNRHTDKSRTVNQIAVEISKELKKEFPDIDLNVQIDTCDMYITQPAIWNRFAAIWNLLARR